MCLQTMVRIGMVRYDGVVRAKDATAALLLQAWKVKVR